MSVFGPSGGLGGTKEFNDEEKIRDVAKRKVSTIRIWEGNYIDAVQMTIQDENSTYDLDKHGGTRIIGGGTERSFTLENDEYITEISGTHDGRFVTTILVRSNKKQLGEVGNKNAEPKGKFKYQALQGTQIIGFYGRSGVLIDSIGVVLDYIV